MATFYLVFRQRFFVIGQLADVFELPFSPLPFGHNGRRLLAVSIKVEHELVPFGRLFGTFFDQVGQFPEQVGTTLDILTLLETEVRLPAVVMTKFSASSQTTF